MHTNKAIQNVLDKLEVTILNTPSGELRDLLTECNILIQSKPIKMVKCVSRTSTDGILSFVDNHAVDIISIVRNNITNVYEIFYTDK